MRNAWLSGTKCVAKHITRIWCCPGIGAECRYARREMRRILKRRLGYGTVGELALWLAAIALFVSAYIGIATALAQRQEESKTPPPGWTSQ
jgi:hypothetical protein